MGVRIRLGDNADSDADDVNTTSTREVTDDSDVLEGEAPGFEAVAPGTYQVTRAGGEIDYIEIHPGMTFSRVGNVSTVRPVEGSLEDHVETET